MTLVLCLVLAFAMQAAAAGTAVDALAQMLDTTTEKFLKADAKTAGDPQSDWAALLAGRTGCTENREAYLDALWDEVSRQYAEDGGLDSIKATEWHRTALTVLALGADPTCFGTDPQGNPIDLIADGTYNWRTTDTLGTQGLNGWVFALITLDAGNYTVPTDGTYQREDMISAILSAQEPDGGFGLTAGQPDVDVTAMALQALAPYQDLYGQEIDRALDYLSSTQTDRGDFENWNSTSAESSAQVILALCSLGIDPRTDARFVKAGGSALDGLLLYQTQTGAFCHTQGDGDNFLATEQAELALCAIQRMDAGKGRVYDFSDVGIRVYESSPSNGVWYAVGIAGAVVLLGLIGICVWKGKKKCTK